MRRIGLCPAWRWPRGGQLLPERDRGLRRAVLCEDGSSVCRGRLRPCAFAGRHAYCTCGRAHCTGS
ncbi:unnamed protein product [Ectocarpus sp. 12 AP-2014]